MQLTCFKGSLTPPSFWIDMAKAMPQLRRKKTNRFFLFKIGFEWSTARSKYIQIEEFEKTHRGVNPTDINCNYAEEIIQSFETAFWQQMFNLEKRMNYDLCESYHRLVLYDNGWEGLAVGGTANFFPDC